MELESMSSSHVSARGLPTVLLGLQPSTSRLLSALILLSHLDAWFSQPHPRQCTRDQTLSQNLITKAGSPWQPYPGLHKCTQKPEPS